MASSSSSSSTASKTFKLKKRWTREQLLRHLEILGPLSAPLPPTLPPSPPASRSSSPAPPSKRKSDSLNEYHDSKRPRTSERPSHPAHERLNPQHRPSSSTSSVASSSGSHGQAPTPRSNNPPIPEAREDGEVPEEMAPVASTSASTSSSTPAVSRGLAAESATTLSTADLDPISSFTPIHRPRRGRPSSTRYFDELHDKFHKHGRMLKYSGDSRFWSTYPSTHKEYRPLPNPPPPNSPYHKHGGLIARLELLDALVCFTYSTWVKDFGRRNCDMSTWATMDPFLKWCKHKWGAEDGYSDAERALQGLIFMIEGYILSRKMVYSCKMSPGTEVKRIHQEMSANMMAAAREAKANPSGASGTGLLPSSVHQSTPPMLPSPASIATASSANSTPTNNSGSSGRSSTHGPSNQQSNSMHNRHPPSSNPQPLIPHGFLPESMRNNYKSIPPHVVKAMASVTSTVSPPFVQEMTDLVMMISASSSLLSLTNSMLNLPIVRKHFPHTYARMAHSTLNSNEEYEPEFEDEDGELFWPGHSISGEGLGWVCLMGKAMIVEFGKAYGYTGLAGVVPKPEPGEEKSRR